MGQLTSSSDIVIRIQGDEFEKKISTSIIAQVRKKPVCRMVVCRLFAYLGQRQHSMAPAIKGGGLLEPALAGWFYRRCVVGPPVFVAGRRIRVSNTHAVAMAIILRRVTGAT